MYRVDSPKTIQEYDELIIHLAPKSPNIFFSILIDGLFEKYSNLRIDDIKNVDQFPIFDLFFNVSFMINIY
jgi:hypothetical protein